MVTNGGMELYYCRITIKKPPSLFQEPINNGHQLLSNCSFPWPLARTKKNPLRLSFPSPLTVNCSRDDWKNGDQKAMSTSSAYKVLDVLPNCTPAELKAAFRAKVKQFHPDVCKGGDDSGTMIRLVIQAYEMLSNFSKSEIIERECLDPFDTPECEAFDIFVNQVLCIGKGCPYSCVKTAPQAFTFDSSTGTARAISQGHGGDYRVEQAVGQCPRNCIHYVTPSQRIILEELLDSILSMPFDCSAEAELIYSLIIKAKFENNRYQKPKKQTDDSTKRVDWF